MGYSHHWQQQQNVPDNRWEQIVAFTWAATALTEVPIGGGQLHDRLPTATEEVITFNGYKTGVEDFALTKSLPQGRNPDLSPWMHCKTEHQPYDEVVVAVLLYLQRFHSDYFYITSDGAIFDPDSEDSRLGQNLLARTLSHIKNQVVTTRGKAE